MKKTQGRPKQFDKDEAITSAMNYFWINGYDNTSLSDLINLLGISKSSFYQTFNSKEELFRLVLDNYVSANCDMLSGLKMQYSSKEILQGFIFRSVKELKERGMVKGCLLMNSGRECYVEHPQMMGKISNYYESGLVKIEELFEDAKQKGDITKQEDANTLAILFHNSLTGLTASIKAGASQQVIDVIVGNLNKMII